MYRTFVPHNFYRVCVLSQLCKESLWTEIMSDQKLVVRAYFHNFMCEITFIFKKNYCGMEYMCNIFHYEMVEGQKPFVYRPHHKTIQAHASPIREGSPLRCNDRDPGREEPTSGAWAMPTNQTTLTSQQRTEATGPATDQRGPREDHMVRVCNILWWSFKHFVQTMVVFKR